VTVRHPLVRSAVYRAASPEERQAVHRALAEATDPAVDPDRRAWHLAQATSGFDEDVASELERSAGRAQDRGGLAAAGAFLERATALTPEPSRRARRALAAAQANHQAGALESALQLASTAESGPLDEFQRAQVDVLRAQISFDSSRGSEAPPLLLKAAKRLEPLDLRLAREIYLDAVGAAVFAGRLSEDCGLRELAQAVRAAPSPSQPPRAPARLLPRGYQGPPVSMPSHAFRRLNSARPPRIFPDRALLERLPGPHLTRSRRAFSLDAHHDSLQLTQLQGGLTPTPAGPTPEGQQASISRTAPPMSGSSYTIPPSAFVTHW